MIKLKDIMVEAAKENAKFQLDILPGDTILAGKFRNKPYIVSSFDVDSNGQPIIITDKGKKIPFLSIRIKKLMPKK